MVEPEKVEDDDPDEEPARGKGGIFGKLLILVLGAILSSLGKFIWDEYIKPKPLYVTIQVFDDSTPPVGLKGVGVWLALNDVLPKQTTDFGLVRFEVPREHRKEVVVPQLTLDGYAQIPGKSPDKVVLDRGETGVIYILRKIVTPTSAAIQETRTYSSGAQASGPGASFSRWYELCNDAVPDAWSVVESSFALTGDRQCNSWSECKQTVNDARKVCWQFRMQGHSEQTGLFNGGNTGIQFSTGVLRVTWKH